MPDNSLNPKQQRFVEEYLVDLNGKAAAIRAGYSEATAEVQGSRLLSHAKVRASIDEALSIRSERTAITADMVLQRWWSIANADPNELIQTRRVCCRYCYGEDHQFQWVQREYLEAVARLKDGETPPDSSGGFGFNDSLDPRSDCPECHGEGELKVHVHDTRKLRGSARLLYGGVKQTRDGIEMRLRDQDKALENVARHLGMFIDRTEVNMAMSLTESIKAIPSS